MPQLNARLKQRTYATTAAELFPRRDKTAFTDGSSTATQIGRASDGKRKRNTYAHWKNSACLLCSLCLSPQCI